MTYQDVLAFIQQNPACFIATMDGDQPRVRGFLAILFNDGCIYFTTGTMKRVYDQLAKNPKVELCFHTPDFQKTLRVSGAIEFVDDIAKKTQLVNERDYLKPYKDRPDDPAFKLLRLPHGKAFFWTMAENTREKDIPVIEF